MKAKNRLLLWLQTLEQRKRKFKALSRKNWNFKWCQWRADFCCENCREGNFGKKTRWASLNSVYIHRRWRRGVEGSKQWVRTSTLEGNMSHSGFSPSFSQTERWERKRIFLSVLVWNKNNIQWKSQNAKFSDWSFSSLFVFPMDNLCWFLFSGTQL